MSGALANPYPVQLCPRILIGEGAPESLDFQLGLTTNDAGPGIEPLGDRNGQWFGLEATVSPTGITASVRKVGLGSSQIVATVRAETPRLDQIVRDWAAGPGGGRSGVPAMPFVARAGLGLLVCKSTAAFRRVTVSKIDK